VRKQVLRISNRPNTVPRDIHQFDLEDPRKEKTHTYDLGILQGNRSKERESAKQKGRG